MTEQKKPKEDKKISLHPLQFEEALKGLFETEPPPKEQQEKKTSTKWRKRSTDKVSDSDTVK